MESEGASENLVSMFLCYKKKAQNMHVSMDKLQHRRN